MHDYGFRAVRNSLKAMHQTVTDSLALSPLSPIEFELNARATFCQTQDGCHVLPDARRMCGTCLHASGRAAARARYMGRTPFQSCDRGGPARTAGFVKGYQMPARRLAVRRAARAASDKPRGRKPRAGVAQRSGALKPWGFGSRGHSAATWGW
jgi:hypothetical protein